MGEAEALKICPRGHLVRYDEMTYCDVHGSPTFHLCRCGRPWRIVRDELGRHEPVRFCPDCSEPGEWVSRGERILWLRDRLDNDLDKATALELCELLSRLAELEPVLRLHCQP